MRLRLISCEILYREMCSLIAKSRNQVDFDFLPKGLHDIGANGMRDRLQAGRRCHYLPDTTMPS